MIRRHGRPPRTKTPGEGDIRRAIWTAPIAIALAACGTQNAPELDVVPPEARVDAGALSGCEDVAVLLDRQVNFVPPLYDFLDAVRTSGCGYALFRVDTPSKSAFSTNYSRAEALDKVRAYRATYALNWTAQRMLEDPRIPDDHIRVTFLAP